MVCPVLVTGASGFLASHLILQLLKQGAKVRGTIRSLENQDKVSPLRNLCPEAKENLELIEADLLHGDCWKAALEGGVQQVYHLASPFPLDPPENEDDVIKPALQGTLHVLQACKESGTVKRVVMTSSTIAIWNQHLKKKGMLTEEDWAESEGSVGAFQKSKVLSEKAAWDLVNQLPEGERFELAVVNPGYIMGPLLYSCQATSTELPKRILERAMPAVPKVNMQIVDVRDVAAAHIKAMNVPEAAGKRHILVADHLWFSEISKIIAEEFSPMGYHVPTKELPNFMLKAYSWVDKTVSVILPILGIKLILDNKRMINVLGIQPRPVKQTILEMCYSLVDFGIAKKTSSYKPRE